MAIQLEFYKNLQPEKEREEPSYHPRIANFQHVTIQKLARETRMAATFGEVEVEATLMELSRCMGNHLCEGGRVHLDEIGYFQVILQATEPVHSLTTRVGKVELGSISFQADRNLKSSCMNSHLRRSKHKPRSVLLSRGEIDKELTTYFATHLISTRSNTQSFCCFTQNMTNGQIRHLEAQGNLQDIGRSTQPIYALTPGHYEK